MMGDYCAVGIFEENDAIYSGMEITKIGIDEGPACTKLGDIGYDGIIKGNATLPERVANGRF